MEDPQPVLISPSPALFISLPANKLHNKLALNVPNNMLRNPLFCCLASFKIVSLFPFNNKPESSRDLTVFIYNVFISSFDIISVVVLPDPNFFFLCIAASAADNVVVNPSGIKTLLANGLIKFFINGNPVLSDKPRRLPKDPLDSIILDN